jgi:glutathionylspermidine synthase
MERRRTAPRADWEQKNATAGLIFDQADDQPYWQEEAYYEFSAREVDDLEEATNTLHGLCLEAAAEVIERDRLTELAIPAHVAAVIQESWRQERSFTLYGRFDLAYDGNSPPKLLEYNADTPTMLLEAAVVQWYWLEEKFHDADQFNSIHERLIDQWKKLKWQLRHSPLYFTYAEDSSEDLATITYLRDTATQAGLETDNLVVSDMGWHRDRRQFVDLAGQPIQSLFKLYPWEWLVAEEFGPHLLETYGEMQWLEPLWKLVLSTKGILPILWELNPGHPNLLGASVTAPPIGDWVKKPRFSREGANVAVHRAGGQNLETPGTYGQEGFIYQQLAPLPNFDDYYPVLGSWIIGGEAAGLGIRESTTLVTDYRSRFVPQLFT